MFAIRDYKGVDQLYIVHSNPGPIKYFVGYALNLAS